MNTLLDDFMNDMLTSAMKVGTQGCSTAKQNAKVATADALSKVIYADAARAKVAGKQVHRFNMYAERKIEKEKVPAAKRTYRKGQRVTVTGKIK